MSAAARRRDPSPALPHAIALEDLAAELRRSPGRVRALAGEDHLRTLPGGRTAVLPAGARAALAAAGRRFPFRVVAHANLKGGIGKTTSALARATRAAQLGYRVALVDLDPQASATLALGVEVPDGAPIFYDLWSRPAAYLPAALAPAPGPLALLPSALENSLLDTSLQNPKAQKNAVRDTAAALREAGHDLVVLDCPPSLGAATISALCAAHHLVIPVGTDAFSFKGLELTLQESAAIAETFALPAPAVHVLLARYDARETVAREAWERLRREHGRAVSPEPVRATSLFGKLLDRGEGLFASRRTHPARDAYKALARRILE
jgi:chromosome partitioning protein